VTGTSTTTAFYCGVVNVRGTDSNPTLERGGAAAVGVELLALPGRQGAIGASIALFAYCGATTPEPRHRGAGQERQITSPPCFFSPCLFLGEIAATNAVHVLVHRWPPVSTAAPVIARRELRRSACPPRARLQCAGHGLYRGLGRERARRCPFRGRLLFLQGRGGEWHKVCNPLANSPGAAASKLARWQHTDHASAGGHHRLRRGS